MMPNVTRGDRLGGLLTYLVGEGRANEHVEPHLVNGDSATFTMYGRLLGSGVVPRCCVWCNMARLRATSIGLRASLARWAVASTSPASRRARVRCCKVHPSQRSSSVPDASTTGPSIA